MGKVKTRLASSVGAQKALAIYEELLRHTRDITVNTSYEKYLFYSEEIQTNDSWSNETFHKRLQISGGLGNKITDSFKHVLESCDSCIIIGSDCPRLSTQHIIRAFDILTDNDIAIGPSFDGGYYLLGMKHYNPELFNNIDWSTDRVYQQTIDKIISCGLSYESLEPLSDVDYIEDWEQWGWEI